MWNDLLYLQRKRFYSQRFEGSNIGVVLSVDRNQSRSRHEELLHSKSDETSNPLFDLDLKRLNDVYARLAILYLDTAEARAVQILSGLQFTTAMQSYQLLALSGGWSHRVQIAAALFIEPGACTRMVFIHSPSFFLTYSFIISQSYH